MSWNPEYALLILSSTVLTYAGAILIDYLTINRFNKKNVRKCVLISVIVLNLSLLFYFKYTNFFFSIVEMISIKCGMDIHIQSMDIILPVGISFYTFQALGYIIDVYKGDVSVEKSFIKYALFVSFFPQLVAGPIERSKEFLPQINKTHKYSHSRAVNGLLMMLYGFFLKIVIADRIAIFVDNVYGKYQEVDGAYLIIASILFSLQIYCDFAGYSSIAIGAAKVLGFDLMQNFDTPYFSQSVTEFWRRWHISLSSWLRDYIYIPLGGNKKGKIRKYINVLITFTVSGLWHGAALHYVLWGMLNGIVQILESFSREIKASYSFEFPRHIKKLICVIYTFFVVTIAWIFFRAESIHAALGIIKKIVRCTNMNSGLNPSIFEYGITKNGFIVLCLSLFGMFVVSVCRYYGIDIRQKILNQKLVIRWICYYSVIIFILVFGVWGKGSEAVNFIYFQF